MRYDLLHHLLLGVAVGAVTYGVLWLITGHYPTPWLNVLAVTALYPVGVGVARMRRAREQRRLQQAYDRPAFGEEW